MARVHFTLSYFDFEAIPPLVKDVDKKQCQSVIIYCKWHPLRYLYFYFVICGAVGGLL